MPQPLVSILIPAYNSSRWIADTLRSAQAQSWANVEILVVDDGSTDETLQIARSFEGPRLKVFTQPNAGAPSARNHALRQAQGDFLQYLDADDLLSPRKIEAQIEALANAPANTLALCGSIHFKDGTAPDSGVREDGWPHIDSDNPVEWLIGLYGGDDGHGGMVAPGAWLTPRKVAEQAGPWTEEISTMDDGEYFCRVVLASTGHLMVRDHFHYYRKFERLGSSLSSSRSQKTLLGAMHSVDRISQALLARTDDVRARRGLARVYMEMALSSYPHSPEASRHGLLHARKLDPEIRIPSLQGKSEWLRRLLGWRLARRLSVLRSRLSH